MLTVRLSGFWALKTIELYKRAIERSAHQLVTSGIRQSEINVLFDARDFPAQSQDVAAEYQRQFSGPDMAVGKVATLVTNTIFRLQAKRVGAKEQCVFESEEEALAWLRE